MATKKPYVVNLDYSPAKQARLKRFCGCMGYKSVRAFIILAIENEIKADLEQLSAEDRKAVELLLNSEQG